MAEREISRINIEAAFVPVDMQAGANAGDWVNMALYTTCIAVLFKAAGTAGDDPIFKLQQAQAADGTGAKDLLFSVIYKKVGTLASVATFTRTEQTAATSHTDAVSAEAQGIFAVEVNAEDLDINNGFTYVQLSVADIGTNAQLGCAFYLMMNPRYNSGVGLDAKV